MAPKKKADKYASSYLKVSGLHESDCAFIGSRFEFGHTSPFSHSESILGLRTKGSSEDLTAVSLLIGTDANYVGAWRSLGGMIWVADNLGHVHCAADPIASNEKGEPWPVVRLASSLRGLWGLDDQNVFAWGDDDRQAGIFHCDGNDWDMVASFDFAVYALRATHTERVVAVGERGRLSIFDGKEWKHLPTGTTEDLVSVDISDNGEIYALGHRGLVIESDGNEISELGRIEGVAPGDARAIAKWKGLLWIAAGRKGLWRRVGNHFQCVGEHMKAVDLDARDQLLVACTDQIISSQDGVTFIGGGHDDLVTLRQGYDLGEWDIKE